MSDIQDDAATEKEKMMELLEKIKDSSNGPEQVDRRVRVLSFVSPFPLDTLAFLY